MSIEAVNQFIIKLSEDKDLQVKVDSIAESEHDSQAMVKVAAEYDYEFTVKELESEIANLLSQIETDELNEEELSFVSGGKKPTMPIAIGLYKARNLAARMASKVRKFKDASIHDHKATDLLIDNPGLLQIINNNN